MVLDHTAADPGADRRTRSGPARCSIARPIIKALEEQQPLWEPGTQAAYHVHNQGFLLGEIMRRVTGMTVGPFLRKEVTEPLHAEYYIGGMDRAEQAHVAEVMPNIDARLFAAKDARRPDGSASARLPAEPGRAVAHDAEHAEWRTVRGRQRQGPRQRARRRADLRRARSREVDGVTLM